MLLYEYQIRDKIDELVNYATIVHAKFDSGASASELLLDTEVLEQLYRSLNEMLPKTTRNIGNLSRHISWMIKYLSKNDINGCRSDIDDICNQDISDITDAFRKWRKKQVHYDHELLSKLSDLVLYQERDSAVRKAFVILKARLVTLFDAPSNLDGPDLINHIFGSSGCHGLSIDNAERQAIRDLLAGLYGLFRNKYGHNDATPSWAEFDAIISMVNFVLKYLTNLKSNATS